MGLAEELAKQVGTIFLESWTERNGQVVPDPEDLGLGNDGMNLEGTVLYADLADSTGLVENESNWFAAEVYKSYLLCASKIIQHFNGEITAFDGDRIMAVFIGNSKNTNAVKTALAINHAVIQIINPKLKGVYKEKKYIVRHGVGVDTSDLFVARTGVRGSNDLVWIGNAANYAAKLCSLREEGYNLWITDKVYGNCHSSVRSIGGTNIWEERFWSAKNKKVYTSRWYSSV